MPGKRTHTIDRDRAYQAFFFSAVCIVLSLAGPLAVVLLIPSGQSGSGMLQMLFGIVAMVLFQVPAAILAGIGIWRAIRAGRSAGDLALICLSVLAAGPIVLAGMMVAPFFGLYFRWPLAELLYSPGMFALLLPFALLSIALWTVKKVSRRRAHHPLRHSKLSGR